MNIVCTICSDLLTQAESIHVTKCGHIFHFNCLSQWISRSKTCPQCRNKVTDRCMFRIYPTISNENATSTDTVETLRSKLDDAELRIREQKIELKTAKEKIKKDDDDLNDCKKTQKSLEYRLMTKVSALVALRQEINYLKVENKLVNKLKEENENMAKKLHKLNGLDIVMNAVVEDVEQILKGYTDAPTIALFATALKRALVESEKKKNEYRNRLVFVNEQLAADEERCANYQARMIYLEEKLARKEALLNEYIKKSSSAKEQADISQSDNSKNKRPSSETQADQPGCSRTKRPRRNTKDATPGTSGTTDNLGKGEKAGQSGKDMSFETAESSAADARAERNMRELAKQLENSESHYNPDSPYLQLKQGHMALQALNLPFKSNDERNELKEAKIEIQRLESCSIFGDKHNKTKKQMEKKTDSTYDGFGGHSKLDVFPKTRPVLRSRVPKVTAKHKLKRPAKTGSQDITKMFK